MHNLFLANLTATTQIQVMTSHLDYCKSLFTGSLLDSALCISLQSSQLSHQVTLLRLVSNHVIPLLNTLSMASHLTPSGSQSPYNGLKALFTPLYNPVYLSSISYQTPHLVPRRGRAKISSSCFSNKVK